MIIVKLRGINSEKKLKEELIKADYIILEITSFCDRCTEKIEKTANKMILNDKNFDLCNTCYGAVWNYSCRPEKLLKT